MQSRQHGAYDASSPSASSLGDIGSTGKLCSGIDVISQLAAVDIASELVLLLTSLLTICNHILKPLCFKHYAPTESSFDVVGGISTSSSSIPVTSHKELDGILDRFTFRPKSLAAQKSNLHVGEYEKAIGSSMTAASARLGLPVPRSSSSLNSKYGVGLSSVAGTRAGYPTNVSEKYHHTTSLGLPLDGGVDLMMKLIDMDCLYRSGWIGKVHRLLEQLGSSRHLLRADLASALLVSIRREIAIDLAQDKGMAVTGGSIVLVDGEIGLVVTIQLHTSGFHINYWRVSSVGGNVVSKIYCRSTLGVSTHDATTAMDYDVEASLKRSVHSNQPERVSHPSLCQGTCKGAPDGDMNLHTWAFFVLGLGFTALLLGLQTVESSKKVLWRYSAAVSWHRRRNPRGHWHRRQTFGLVQKRMIYALPFLVVLVAEISAGSVGGAETSKATQDGAGHEASFVSRLSSQLTSVLHGSLSEKVLPDSILTDPTATVELGLSDSTRPSADDNAAVSIIGLSEIYTYHSFFHFSFPFSHAVSFALAFAYMYFFA